MATPEGAGGGAAVDKAVPSWALVDVEDLEAVARTVLDESGEAQRARARWRAHSHELSESWRLAALECVFAAQEALRGNRLSRSVSTERESEMRKVVARELRQMQAELEKPAKKEISEEKVRELVASTGRSERKCRLELELCDGDVNRAAGRLLRLESGDTDSHQRLETPEPAPPAAIAASPHERLVATATGLPPDTGASPHHRLDAPEPALPPDAATATTPQSAADCCGANHAFYANLHKIRSSHSHNGRGAVPRLRCLQRRTAQSSWGNFSEVLTFEGTIEDFHQAFGGRDEFSYSQLEGRHDYIQWLFPSPERSRFNAASLPLSDEEALAIRSDPIAKERMRRSFLLITDFFGFEMEDEKGTLRRNSRTYRSRFANLNTPGNHNFMRISRIINCLNHTGWGMYSQPFLAALYQEAFVTRKLSCCCESFSRFWMKLLPNWEAVAKVEFPDALARLHTPASTQLSTLAGGSGVGVMFGGGVKPKPKAAPIGVAFWNFSDSTVEVYFQLKFVASLGPNKKHGMYSHEGDSFNFRLLPTGDDSAEPFAAWTVTDHHSQQIITEGCAQDGISLGAIVCYNTHPRYEEHRMRAIERVTDAILVERKPVTIQAICERGSCQQYAGASLQVKLPQQAGVDLVETQSKIQDERHSPPFTTGDRIKVHSESSGGWHFGNVTKVIPAAAAVPGEHVWHVTVEYDVDSERRQKLVIWKPGCGTIIHVGSHAGAAPE